MDAFRYFLSIDEKSERVLELTEALIRLNPGHYSVWAYRGETVIAIKADLDKELDLMDELVEQHLKSYQVWQHRRTVVLAYGSPKRELGFTSKALNIDAKNYHTWAYRQWALCHFWGPEGVSTKAGEDAKEVWDGELSYVDGLLADDLRNNSAWNHRFFCVFESGAIDSNEAAVIDRELDFTHEKLKLAPNNASAWNYARGVLKRIKWSLATWLEVAEPFIEKAYLAAEFVADAHVELAKAGDDKAAHIEKAVKLYDSISERDPIRAPMNAFKKKRVEAL